MGVHHHLRYAFGGVCPPDIELTVAVFANGTGSKWHWNRVAGASAWVSAAPDRRPMTSARCSGRERLMRALIQAFLLRPFG